jgi:hypothetical protein
LFLGYYLLFLQALKTITAILNNKIIMKKKGEKKCMSDLDGLVKSIKEALFSSKETAKTTDSDSSTATPADEKIPRKDSQ